jgi:anti-anti-sigma factor
MKPHFVEFRASSPVGLRAQAVDAADAALRRGTNLLVLGLDSLSMLDDASIAAMIVALRRLREIGGTVRLVTQSAAHRKRLMLTGLDRIFDVFASAEEAQGRVEQRHGTFLTELLGFADRAGRRWGVPLRNLIAPPGQRPRKWRSSNRRDRRLRHY